MPRSFLQLWTRVEFESQQESGNPILAYATGNQFKQRGMQPGDNLYVVACFSDTLFLLGCLKVEVGPIAIEEAIAKGLLGKNHRGWAKDHLFASEHNAKPMCFDLKVSATVLLNFLFADGNAPKFRGSPSELKPDPQTFRGVRELSPKTAADLASLLGENLKKSKSDHPPLKIINIDLPTEKEKIRALSIRQPYAERILRGDKKIEYRTWPTTHRGRIYIYAAKTPVQLPGHEDPLDPLKLPRGVLVGTVEIVDCKKGEKYFEWGLRNPVRFDPPLTFNAFPQAGYFYPFGKG